MDIFLPFFEMDFTLRCNMIDAITIASVNKFASIKKITSQTFVHRCYLKICYLLFVKLHSIDGLQRLI